MVNLRPRVQEFNPGRRIETPGGGGGDTFIQASVNTGAQNQSLQDLAALRDFSPSLSKFLDRAHETSLNQLQAEADITVGKLTPEQVRQQSVNEWEAYSKKSGIDNAWWKIFLDEASGRKAAQSYAVNLASHSLEATDPENPQAHLAILEREKGRATQGLGFYALAAFNKESEQATKVQGRRWAEQRAQRVEAKLDEDFVTSLRANIRQQADPMLGGEVDLEAVTEGVNSFHARTGESGRKELMTALNDAISVGIGGADSVAVLDDTELQVRALLDAAALLEVGPDGTTLDDISGLELDDAYQRLSNLRESREQILSNRAATTKTNDTNDIRSKASGVAVGVFDGSMSMEEADEKVLQLATEISEKTGTPVDELVGAGMLSLHNSTATLEASRYTNVNDPATVVELEKLILSPDFDEAAYVLAVLGAADDRKLTVATAQRLMSSGTATGRAVVVAAHTNAAPPLRDAKGLYDEMSEAVISEVVGKSDRAVVQGEFNDQYATFASQENQRLADAIRAAGAGGEAMAVDTWKQGLNARVAEFSKSAEKSVRGKLQGGQGDGTGTAIGFNPKAAFDGAVRSRKGFDEAQRDYVFDSVAEDFAGREEEARALVNEILGQDDYFGTNPIGDLATMISGNSAYQRSGRAAELKNAAESAFMSEMIERAGIAEGGVNIDRAAAAEAARWAESRASEPPAAISPPPTTAEAPTFGALHESAVGAQSGYVAAVDREKALIAAGAPAEQVEQANREQGEAHEALLEAQAKAWQEHQFVLDVFARHGDPVSIIERDFDGAGEFSYGRNHNSKRGKVGPKSRELYLSEGRFEDWQGVEFRNGKIWVKTPPRTGPWLNSSKRVDLAATEKLQKGIEDRFFAAKLFTGISLDDVRRKSVAPYEGAPDDERIALDTSIVKVYSTPLFQSEAELDALVSGAPVFPGGDYRTVQNEDGTRSNVLTATFEIDGKHFVLPTMVAGKKLSSEGAVKKAKELGLDKYPAFGSAEEALSFSREIHGNIDARGFLLDGGGGSPKLDEALALFPGVTKEQFIASQRRLILERIPQSNQ